MLPDFGLYIEEILSYAVDYLNFFDQQRLLWVISGFSLGTTFLLWIIKTIQNPPRLDI